jgi:type II secretory pathway pseudopilin PulG
VRLRDESGYSLFEAIAVMAILGTIVGAMTTLFVSGSRAQVQMNERFQAQNNTRLALDRMRRDVHCSSAAAATTTLVTLTNSCLTEGSVTWCTAASGTRFELRRLAGAGTCSTAGRVLAENLVNGTVFQYQAPSISNLGKLRVDLRVQLPSMQTDYRLCDLLVLRNTTRQGSTGTAVPAC